MGMFDASKSAVKINLVHIPIANMLSRPGGPVTHILRPFLDAFTLNDYQRVVVITLFYYFMTYTGSVALSITGSVIGNPDGYQNEAFAICVAITLALPLYIADSTEPMNRCINFLLLAAFCKTVLYVPAYVLGYPTFRTFTHLMNNGALLGLIISVIKAAHVKQDPDPLFDITLDESFSSYYR
ncbi:hypothetical protein Clacol_009999 [Clathrus columnatus]|uniref:Uncharacterized protein n=1 Tax=Clathrus columnatus TaxID=1419009 RepID=A0AAV5AM59_9AGAM|nr:hypothetical protein Clacol_009999 [Clathrus columnatus]